MEGLEKELDASKAARHLAESNATNSSKVAKVVEAKAVTALSCLTTSEMELEGLRSRQAEMEVEMGEAVEKLKDAQFEEVEALYSAG